MRLYLKNVSYGGYRMEKFRPVQKVCMDAMHQLMQTKNLNRITVHDIISSAGISKATFYRYYKDKNDLFEQMIWRDVKFIFTPTCSLEQWRIRVAEFCTRLKEDRVVHYKLARNNETAFKNFYTNVLYELFLKRAYRLRDKEQFTMTRQLHRRFLYMSGGAATVIYEWIMSGCPDSPEDFADLLANMIGENGSVDELRSYSN